MRLVEVYSSVVRSKNGTREISNTSTELLMYIVGVLAQYKSGSVRVSSYYRGRLFRVEFTSAGDKYGWFFEEVEDSMGLLRLFMLFCYYSSLQESPDRSDEFERWSKRAHQDMGLSVKSPLNVKCPVRTLQLWGQLKVALLHTLDIGLDDTYDEYSSKDLADAWGLHELMGISFDEALTPTS